jgi:hypothetical protein
VLRPPAAFFARTPRSTRSTISRCAVSCEHLASFAHFDEVSLPSSPSSNEGRRGHSLSSRPRSGWHLPAPGPDFHRRVQRHYGQHNQTLESAEEMSAVHVSDVAGLCEAGPLPRSQTPATGMSRPPASVDFILSAGSYSRVPRPGVPGVCDRPTRTGWADQECVDRRASQEGRRLPRSALCETRRGMDH